MAYAFADFHQGMANAVLTYLLNPIASRLG